MQRNMTTGNATKHIILFSLPILLGNLFQQAYSFINMMIIGHSFGDGALAAIGASFPIYTVMNTLVNGMITASSIVVARYFGAKDETRVKKSMANTIKLNAYVAFILAAAGIAVSIPMMRMMNTPGDIFVSARNYVWIMLLSMPLNTAYFLEIGVLRSIGNSVMPLILLIVYVLSNIGLDFVCVAWLKLGAEGSAISMALAHAIASVIGLIYILKKEPLLCVSKKDFVREPGLAKDMFTLGTAIGLSLSIVQVGSLVMQGAINSFGSALITSHSASRRVLELTLLPMTTMGTAAATFASQNIGANKPWRILKGVRSSNFICFVWAALVSAVVYFAGSQVVGLITGSTNLEVINMSVLYLKVHIPLYVFLGPLFVYRSTLQSMNNKSIPIVTSTIELVVKVIVTFVLVPMIGYYGVIASESSVWVMCGILLAVVYYSSDIIRSAKYQVKLFKD